MTENVETPRQCFCAHEANIGECPCACHTPENVETSKCNCPRFSDTGGYRIADLTCPTHGVGGTDPGDGMWDSTPENVEEPT